MKFKAWWAHQINVVFQLLCYLVRGIQINKMTSANIYAQPIFKIWFNFIKRITTVKICLENNPVHSFYR